MLFSPGPIEYMLFSVFSNLNVDECGWPVVHRCICRFLVFLFLFNSSVGIFALHRLVPLISPCSLSWCSWLSDTKAKPISDFFSASNFHALSISMSLYCLLFSFSQLSALTHKSLQMCLKHFASYGDSLSFHFCWHSLCFIWMHGKILHTCFNVVAH